MSHIMTEEEGRQAIAFARELGLYAEYYREPREVFNLSHLSD